MAQLVDVSGLGRPKSALSSSILDGRGLLDERESGAPDSLLDSSAARLVPPLRQRRLSTAAEPAGAGAARGRQGPQCFSLAWLIEYFGISIVTSLLGDDRLARQARGRLQAPGAIEQVLLAFVGLAERGEALAHNDVAGRAGTAHLAGVSISMWLSSSASQIESAGAA